MDVDLNTLLRVSPTLNLWLVVLLGSSSGLLVFAISSALYARHLRHRRTAKPRIDPRAVRVRRALGTALTIFVLIMLVQAVPSLVDARGWLSADGLFTVMARTGFLASYPNSNRQVTKGEVILKLIRDAGPEEVAAAENQRALLNQELEFSRLEALRIDPLLLTAQITAKEQLQSLEERSQKLSEARAVMVRGVPQQQSSDQAQIYKELQKTRRELEQNDISLKAATNSYEIVSRAESKGLFPADEVVRRAERFGLLHSRQTELHERIDLLTHEQQRLRDLSVANGKTYDEQVQRHATELTELQAQTAEAREHLQSASQAVERDKLRAQQQRQNRIRQIELRIAELDELLNAGDEGLEVRSPMDGVVGFREPSPAGIRTASRPLLVLYRPGSIVVKLHVPANQSPPVDKRVRVDLQALLPETMDATFFGRIIDRQTMSDGSIELQVACEPPEAALRELAIGASIPIRAVIRRPNPLAMSGIPWSWWLMGAVVFGLMWAEIRLWLQRRALAGASNHRFTIDWGGNPDEFLEYVAGVGLVPRNICRTAQQIIPWEERNGGLEVALTKLSDAEPRSNVSS
ncbi:membrane hypothetical protein [Gammaproteobacteria bacterium]